MACPNLPVAPSVQKAMADYLRELRWREDREFLRRMRGAQVFTSRDSQFCAVIEGDAWDLGEFTGADIDGIAIGRYKTVESGNGLESLDDAVQGRTSYLLFEDLEEERAEAEAEYQADLWEDCHPEVRCPPRE